MTPRHSLAVLRLKQWAYDRALIHKGRVATLKRRGWTERHSRTADARLVRVLAFEQALQRITHPARVLLVLSYRDGYSAAHIARMLDCSERTIRTHLHHARESLALLLERLDLL